MESSFPVDSPRKIELLRRQRIKEPGHGDIFWETNGIKSYQFKNWALVLAILRD